MKQSARAKRLEEYLTDTYDYEEALEGMHIYAEDNLVFPFQAKLKCKRSCEVTVTGIASGSLDHCVVCKAKLKGVLVKIPVTELEPIRSRHNTMIIEDYIAWLKGNY